MCGNTSSTSGNGTRPRPSPASNPSSTDFSNSTAVSTLAFAGMRMQVALFGTPYGIRGVSDGDSDRRGPIVVGHGPIVARSGEDRMLSRTFRRMLPAVREETHGGVFYELRMGEITYRLNEVQYIVALHLDGREPD